MNAADYLRGRDLGGGAWSFEIGEDLYGAFGGAFGGVVAAACLIAARSLALRRTPVSLDCRFVRGLPAGAADVRATLVHEGRTLSTAGVEVVDARGRTAARCLASLLDEDAAAPTDVQHPTRPTWTAHDEGRPWGPVAPIARTLDPRFVGRDGHAAATSVRVPWDEPGAEAVCVAADVCVGPPVAAAVAGAGVTHPNPDLSLRFSGTPAHNELVGFGRTLRAAGGVAAVAIEVWCGEAAVGVGASSSLLLPAR